jgi:hypothetical protein
MPAVRRRQLVYGLVAVLLAAFAAFEAVKYGAVAALTLLVFFVVPDLALVGSSAARKGRLTRRAVVAYNIMHSYWPPIVIMSLSALGWPELWLRPGLEVFLAGLGWATHISVDRAFEFRFRTWDGRQRLSTTFA